jgi:hypothetical protein
MSAHATALSWRRLCANSSNPEVRCICASIFSEWESHLVVGHEAFCNLAGPYGGVGSFDTTRRPMTLRDASKLVIAQLTAARRDDPGVSVVIDSWNVVASDEVLDSDFEVSDWSGNVKRLRKGLLDLMRLCKEQMLKIDPDEMFRLERSEQLSIAVNNVLSRLIPDVVPDDSRPWLVPRPYSKS